MLLFPSFSSLSMISMMSMCLKTEKKKNTLLPLLLTGHTDTGHRPAVEAAGRRTVGACSEELRLAALLELQAAEALEESEMTFVQAGRGTGRGGKAGLIKTQQSSQCSWMWVMFGHAISLMVILRTLESLPLCGAK